MAKKIQSPVDQWRRFALAGRKIEKGKEKEYAEEIDKTMRRCLAEIEAQIDTWYAKYADHEGITIAEARRRVSEADIEYYAGLAERYVKTKDFSDKANSQMKLYNTMLRINRLTTIEAVIGLELSGTFSDLERYIGGTLDAETIAEYDRYAEVLGANVDRPVERLHNVVHEALKGADWTDRLWANNRDRLERYLQTEFESALISGKSPRALVKDFRKHFASSADDALTLLTTELTRCQTGAAKISLEENGNDYYRYITTNPVKPCKVCLALEEKTKKEPIKTSEMEPGKNAPPMHPVCHCVVAPWVDEKAYNDWLDSFAGGGDDDYTVY